MSRRQKDPYISGLYVSVGKLTKRDTIGEMVGLADALADKRGLSLIPQRTRGLHKHEIHELLTTDEADVGPGKTVNRVGLIGFFEVTRGGVTAVGDHLSINDREIGKVVGFDETHFPNHYNLVLFSADRPTGIRLGIRIGDIVRIGSLRQKSSELGNVA